MPRLDARQRRLLALLSETEWRSTEAVFAETSLYRTLIGVGIVLGQFVRDGLVEHRTVRCRNRDHDRSEWRLLAGGERAAS